MRVHLEAVLCSQPEDDLYHILLGQHTLKKDKITFRKLNFKFVITSCSLHNGYANIKSCERIALILVLQFFTTCMLFTLFCVNLLYFAILFVSYTCVQCICIINWLYIHLIKSLRTTCKVLSFISERGNNINKTYVRLFVIHN